MHYTLREGVHNSWRDRANEVLQHVRHHNWLPMAVATIVTAWLALIFSGLTQSPPSTPAAPVATNSTKGSLNAGYQTKAPANVNTSGTATANSANTTHAQSSSRLSGGTASTGTAKAASNPAAVTAPSTAAPTTDQTAGRGSDDTEAQAAQSAASISGSTNNDDTADATANAGVDLSPLLNASVGIGGNSLVQPDVNVGDTDVL